MGQLHLHTLGQRGAAAQEGDGAYRCGPRPPVREDRYAVFVNPEVFFQPFLGLGAAVTDASATVFARLPKGAQERILHACWSPKAGNGYTFARTSIHSCDFSPYSYTYCEAGDEALSTFSIAEDRKSRIPLLKAAANLTGSGFKLVVSPWSAPAWMKDNQSMTGGGRLKPEYWALWARYIHKFLEAWAQEGLPAWGLTVQNEPAATQTWESMLWSAEEERRFAADYLLPLLQEAGGTRPRLLGWDHNRDLLADRAHTLLANQPGESPFCGLGFHWYETWSGAAPAYANVAAVHAAYPSTPLIMTEACIEGFNPDALGAWDHAEYHAQALMGDLGAGASAWIAWNVLLDLEGGPNHVGNYCFAPIHADPDSGEVIFTPTHEVLGLFSRHLKAGARRVSCSVSRSAITAIAFKNPDASLATFVLNPTDSDLELDLHLGEAGFSATLPARSVRCLHYQP
ncbi:MAG: hypothetical protein RLZZ174_811 [Pseudomonadota bacterium]|jgi:glucosylceramidase